MNKSIIHRESYFEYIAPYIGNSLIKVLIGQRRVGKSYILFQLMEEIRKESPDTEIIYINKEDFAFVHIKDTATLINHIEAKGPASSKKAIFIDEVQEIEGFEKALRSLQLNSNYDIYCTGSNATMLSGELATYLAGRYIQIRVYALTYEEFLLFHQLSDSNESFTKYLKYGGMPHLVNLKNEERIYYEYLRNVFDTIVLRDIVTRFKVRNVHFLNNLIQFIADNIGCVVSAKRISDYLKSQNIQLLPKLVLEYMYYLETVFFVERVKRTDVNGRKIFEIGDKFYFEDLGMRHALIPYQQKDVNKILENVVYHHLRARRYEVRIGKYGEKEIDFVAQKNGKTTYIQVTYLITDEQTHNREFGNLLLIPDNNRKIVVSMDPLSGNEYKGIEHWPIRDFLLNRDF